MRGHVLLMWGVEVRGSSGEERSGCGRCCLVHEGRRYSGGGDEGGEVAPPRGLALVVLVQHVHGAGAKPGCGTPGYDSEGWQSGSWGSYRELQWQILRFSGEVAAAESQGVFVQRRKIGING